MRICILTQPLQTNYGGLLQAYALQTVLKRMGHEVWTEDRRRPKYSMKRFIAKILTPIRGVYYPTESQNNYISQNTNKFICKYINTTEPIYTINKEMFQKYHFDAYIVGSDQVWRPVYSYYLPNYFLDFTAGDKVKRIAYAASFGTSKWEFTSKQKKKCAILLKKFDAVSVREYSGVILCKKYLGVDAVQLLDPTLLLNKNDYIDLIKEEKTPPFKNRLMTYVLDPSKEKKDIIYKVSKATNHNLIVVMPENNFYQVGAKEIDKCIFPPVTNWLRGFMDAEYVVTDSFHGMVFSIIFNKPFIVIANQNRGLDRFTSLLKKLNLESRLVYSLDDVTDELINTAIDYKRIDQVIDKEKEKARNFLLKYLMNEWSEVL